jgi:hypothetical protein
LLDLAAALREPGAIDAALIQADEAGLGAAMRHALMLAHDWLGLPVGETTLAQARASAGVRRLDRILAHLYAGQAWHQTPVRNSWRGFARYSIWKRLYRLSLKPDMRYWTSQARREWFSPNDWDAVRLPDTLIFLYPAFGRLAGCCDAGGADIEDVLDQSFETGVLCATLADRLQGRRRPMPQAPAPMTSDGGRSIGRLASFVRLL